MKSILVEDFNKKGLITSLEANSIPRGASPDLLNWESLGDRIVLRRGMIRVNPDAGVGINQGIFTSKKSNGDEVTFWKRGQKLLYTDDAGITENEIGTNQFGSDAEDDNATFGEYVTNHGNQVWINSPNSSLYKIMVANPESITDMYVEAKNFKGHITFFLNRMFLWGRNEDKTGVYGSYIDSLNNTVVADESIGTGDGSEKTFDDVLVFKAAGARRTCFAIIGNDEDSVETFTDDYSGVLTGSLGGSGTINYTTGAVVLTFNSAPTAGKDIRITYQWEDSTDGGVADFTKSGTRLAGEGFIFRQDTGEAVTTIKTYNDIQYCFHKAKIWRLNITVDDTNATNRIYRENAGCTSLRGAVSTGDGIYFIDTNDQGNPEIRLLTLASNSAEVIPVSKSLNLDLSKYSWDKAVLFQFDKNILAACRFDSDQNNFLFALNKQWKSWSLFDYYVNDLTINNGALWAADTITGNIFELFSGLDEDNAEINNYFITNLDKLDLEELKKCKRLPLKGNIGSDQKYRVSAAVDNGEFVEIGTMDADDDAVDKGISNSVGNLTVGKNTVGGGDLITAFSFYKEFSFNLGKFEEVQLKFEALKIGWLDFSSYEYKDIRKKEKRIPKKYR